MSKIRQTEMPNNLGEVGTNPIFLSRQDLCDLGIRVSSSTLIRWQIAGKFPKACRLGGCTLAWPKDQVMRWCDQCIKDAENFTYADF